MTTEEIQKLKQFLKVKITYKEMCEDTANSIIEFCNEYLTNNKE